MEQKEETKFFDFTQVEMEVSFDEKMKVDISKTLGNVIHQNTGDLGLDEIARTIYCNRKHPENATVAHGSRWQASIN